jgi:hypothetical protein
VPKEKKVSKAKQKKIEKKYGWQDEDDKKACMEMLGVSIFIFSSFFLLCFACLFIYFFFFLKVLHLIYVLAQIC